MAVALGDGVKTTRAVYPSLINQSLNDPAVAEDKERGVTVPRRRASVPGVRQRPQPSSYSISGPTRPRAAPNSAGARGR